MLFLTVSDVLESHQCQIEIYGGNVCEQERQWKAAAIAIISFWRV